MRTIIFTFLFFTLSAPNASAQKKLLILKTNTTSISIKEDSSFYKDTWTVSPEVKLDVFVTNHFLKSKKITFYSDIDSLSFDVKPNRKYDFIILLNGKDTA